MQHERWEKLQELADRVFAASPDEREQLIEDSCRGDAALGDELRKLVRAFDDPSFLETPAVELLTPAIANAAHRERAGDRVGPFIIHELIGSGGMGTVYRASRADVDFEQTVALKLINVPRPSSPRSQAAARFLREQRVLASLEHPSIARLIEGGIAEDGMPYIAMELVKGERIDAHAAGLPLRDRLRLMADVCDAVQYAHGKLIVHRDLKPDNIIVTPEGRAVLLDFGVAKLLSDEFADDQPTLTKGHAPFTLQYASPEQVSGERVTAATDVYALGLILYELLAGEPPYRVPTRSLAGAAETIRTIQPKRPSTKAASIGGPHALRTARLLRGDLDTIILRAIDKDPARRYQSAADLGADIQRHLQGLPVRARRDTSSYRIGKFIRRNRVPVAALATVVLALAAGLVVSLIALNEVRNARAGERDQRLAAEEMNSFLVSMFEALDPAQTKAQDVGILRSLLDAGASRLDDKLGARPVAAAQMRATIGSTYKLIGELDDARTLLERNLEQRNSLLGSDHPDSLASAQQLGALYLATGDFEASAALLSDTLETQRRVLSDDHPAVLRTLNDLGEAQRQVGDTDAALESLQSAADARARVLGERHRETLISLNNLAGVYVQQRRFDEALPIAERVYELQRDVLGDDHLDTLVSASDLGLIHRNLGQADIAVNYGRTAYEGLSRVLGPGHMDTIVTGTNLAGQLRSLARRDEALELYAHLEAVARESLPADHFVIPWLVGSQALCFFDDKRYEDAEPLFLASYEGLAAALGEDNQYTRIAAGRLVAFYETWHKPSEADAWRAKPNIEQPR